MNGGSSAIKFGLLGQAIQELSALAYSRTKPGQVPIPECPSERSVCNIALRNGSSLTFRQQCLCAGGRKCPTIVDDKDGAIFVEEKWLMTCSPRDVLPVCQPGQLSVLAVSNGAEGGAHFQVLCVCQKQYTPSEATQESGGGEVKASMYCTGYQNSTDNIDGEAIQILNNEELPATDDPSMYYLSVEDDKRSRSNTAFYKRGSPYGNLNAFYKRGPSDSSAFYKRGGNDLSSFYKRIPFIKRAPFYKRKQAIKKRSVEDTFDDRTPMERSSIPDGGVLDDGTSSNFRKKDVGFSSFYKRGLNNDVSSFYKRGGNGISSFYKRTPEGNFKLNSPDVDELDYYLTPEEDSGEATFMEREDAGDDLSSLYNSSLPSFYKRVPWYNSEGTSSFYRKRALGGGNSAFYKRDGSSEENVLDKRAIGKNLNSFYKRSRTNPSVSRFYKRYISNTGSPYGISNFYKRGFGDVSNFYKRRINDVSNFYKRRVGDDSRFYKRGVNDDSRFYKRDLEDASSMYGNGRGRLSRFYKRDVGGVSNFYKRGLDDEFAFYKRGYGDVSHFYKRSYGDLSHFYKRGSGDLSNFYKRGFSDLSNFYKRGDEQHSFYKKNTEIYPQLHVDGAKNSEQVNGLEKRSTFPNENIRQSVSSTSRVYKRAYNDLSAFYKRAPSDVSSFYKRTPSGVSSFYKRTPSTVSSFYKRTPSDVSSFYKRTPSTVSSFYKRTPSDVSSFYKRTPSDVSSFYKRTPSDVSSFYKRTPSDVSSFYKRTPSDVSTFYKRTPSDVSSFYKRTPSDISSFYKRTPSDVSSFYKRTPSDVSSFYKRASFDGSISSFYKRIPYDHSSSSFYKRANDINAFYKRSPGSNTMSNFYKRFGQDLNAFYKRSPYDLQAFYKRSSDAGRSHGDLENFLHEWRENNIAKLYQQNTSSDQQNTSSDQQNTSSDHTDSESIENSGDTDLANQLEGQQNKQNLQ